MSAGAQIALDDEDRFRLVRAENEVLALRMRALTCVSLPDAWSDRHFIRHVCALPVERVTPRQGEHVHRLAWRYRRFIPRHLAPRANPDDPLVRAEAAAERAALEGRRP